MNERMKEHTEESKRIEHVHTQKCGKSELQKIHDRLEHASNSTGLCDEVLQTWYLDLQSCFGSAFSSHVRILGVQAMLLSSSRQHLWPNGFGHLRWELFDKFLKPRWEVGIGALNLIFGVREKRL